MENLNEFKTLWKAVPLQVLPDGAQIVEIIKKDRQKTLKKYSILLATALLFLSVMIWVVFFSGEQNMVTRVGAILIFMSCIILLVTNISTWKRFYSLNNCSSKEYLSFLRKTQQRQLFYYKTTQLTLLVICGIGIFLMLAGIVKSNLAGAITGYILITLYFAFVWFFVRPRVYKKEVKKLSKKIDQLENISKQLNFKEDEKEYQ